VDNIRNDDRREDGGEKKWEDRAPTAMTRWLVILAVVFLGVAIIGGAYAYQQSLAVSDLTLQNQSFLSTISQMRSQIEGLTEQLSQMAAPPPAVQTQADASPAKSQQNGIKRPSAAQSAAPRSAAQDRRMRQIQSQLDEQRKQLKETRDQVATTKSDLEGEMGSTRDELNGSIAKTHDELVTLEKRGERNYFEFSLSKSKSFEREGPVQISLRKADSKHQSYDLMMLVDDHQLSKKKVDLYEPIWLHEADEPQPVQIVVNKIDKDHVYGYISAPKFKDSELTSNAAQPSMDMISKPISTSPPTSSSHSTPSSSSTTAISSRDQQSPSK